MLDMTPRQSAVVLLAAKMRVSAKRDNTPVHRAADAGYKAMMLAVSASFMRGKKAYKSGGVDAAVKAIRAALLETLPTPLAALWAAGGNAGLALLGRRARVAPRAAGAVLRTAKPQVPGQPHDTKPPFNLQFNATDENAIAWARMHVSQIADDISQTSKDAINEAIAQSLEGEGSAYDDILAAVGDEARAEMIARTETMDAANQGALAAWSEAQDAGLLSADATKVWIPSSGCCDDCSDLDEEEVAIDDDFSSGD